MVSQGAPYCPPDTRLLSRDSKIFPLRVEMGRPNSKGAPKSIAGGAQIHGGAPFEMTGASWERTWSPGAEPTPAKVLALLITS